MASPIRHIVALGAAVVFVLGGRAPRVVAAERPSYLATIPPAAMIVREVAGERGDVRSLLPPGASPHTYSLRPSQVKSAEAAAAVISIGPALDPWAGELPAARRIELLGLVPDNALLRLDEEGLIHLTGPEEGHAAHGLGEAGEPDPHFWLDPMTVRELLPALAERLGEIDPEGAADYRANADRLAKELEALDAELSALLEPVRGRAAILFHSSMHYLLERYGIRVAGVVEPAPGKSPSPKALARLIELARRERVRAIFTEPQLAARPAEIVAEAAGLEVWELDPLGGRPERETYAELLRYNARILRNALE